MPGNNARCFFSEIIETAAPVSISMRNFVPLTSTLAYSGSDVCSPIVNNDSSSWSLEAVCVCSSLADTYCVCCCQYLLGPSPHCNLLEDFLALQAGAMWPFFLQKCQLGSWLGRPHQ